MAIQSIKNSTSGTENEIDLGKLIGVIIDARWVIIITTLVFGLISGVYAFFSTPIYRADVLVQVEEKSSGIPGLDDVSEMFSSESSADTEIQILNSRMVLGKTVDKLNMTVNVKPKFFPLFGKGFARLTDQKPSVIKVNTFRVPRDYLDEVFVLVVLPERKFDLTYSGDIVLHGTANQLTIKDGFTILADMGNAKPGDEFIVSKQSRIMAITDLKDKLSISEQGKKTGVLRLTLEGENPQKVETILNTIAKDYLLQNVDRASAEAGKSLTFLKKHVPQIRNELNIAEARLNRYKSKNDSVDLQLEAESVLKSLVTIESQLNEITFKESDIEQRYTKSHPAYIALLDKRNTLLDERKRLNERIARMPKTQQEIVRLTRDVEVNQQIYIQLMGKIQELSVMKASAVGNVRILDHAATLDEPVRPVKAIVIAFSVFIGLILSMGWSLIRHALHKGIENPDDIEAIGLPVYASIPKSDLQVKLSESKHHKHSSLLAITNPADISIEALRGLRTSLHFAMMEAKNNILMISGPAPGIGKSFVSSNFAVVAANTGQRVLLVDADMRKGYLQKLFGLKWDNGFSDYLSGKLSIEQVIKKTDLPNLDVVTRGQVPPNPSELLMHTHCREFIDWASSNYDLVIIDTPPVLAVTDPSIIGRMSGTTLMVGRFGKNSVKEIEVAKDRFFQSGVEVKGFILNAIERKASGTYSEYGYYNYDYSEKKN